MYGISSGKIKLSGIFQIALFIMCSIYLTGNIYFFSNNKIFSEISNFLLFISYILLMCVIINNFKNVKLKWIKYLIIALFVALISIDKARSTGVLKYFLLILASKNVRYTKIIRTLLLSYVSITFFSLLLFILGISAPMQTSKNAISLGFVHPNVTSLILVVMYFLICSINNSINLQNYLLLLLLFFEIFFIQKSKVAAVILVIYPIVFWCIKKNGIKNNVKCKYMAEFSQLFVFLIVVLLFILYPLSIYDKFRDTIDSFLSYRPYLNFNNLMHYGVSLWGRKVEIYNTSDYAYNYYLGYASNIKFNTVDCAYVIGLISIGIIPMIIMFILYINVIRKAWNNSNYIVITVSIMFALYGFIENGTNDLFCFFTLFYLLANDDMYNSFEVIKGENNDT